MFIFHKRLARKSTSSNPENFYKRTASGTVCPWLGISKARVAVGEMVLIRVAILVGMPELEILTVHARFKQNKHRIMDDRIGFGLNFMGSNP